MQHLIKILKGIAIGIANIIPGFSGGTMAIIVKIYDEFLDALANLTKYPLQVVKKSWSLFIGIILGLVLGFMGIVKLMELAPLITVLFFFGLVLGSIPKQAQDSITKPFKKTTLIPFVAAFVIIVVLPIIAGMNLGKAGNDNSFVTYIVVFVLGIISAAAMVLPGLSGSMMLLIFGYYNLILNSIEAFVKGFISFEFSGLLEPFLILLVLIVGVVIGVIFMSKLIRHLYTKYPSYCNMAVLGLLIASLFAILYSSNTSFNYNLFNAKVWEWAVGVIAAVAGAGLTFYFNFYQKKQELEEDVLMESSENI